MWRKVLIFNAPCTGHQVAISQEVFRRAWRENYGASVIQLNGVCASCLRISLRSILDVLRLFVLVLVAINHGNSGYEPMFVRLWSSIFLYAHFVARVGAWDLPHQKGGEVKMLPWRGTVYVFFSCVCLRSGLREHSEPESQRDGASCKILNSSSKNKLSLCTFAYTFAHFVARVGSYVKRLFGGVEPQDRRDRASCKIWEQL